MQPYGDEYDGDVERSEPVAVTDIAKPTAQWSWTPQRIAIAAGSIVTLGFVIWFVMEFNKAKLAAIAKAATNNVTA